jgi:hypothetical protein
MLRVEVDCEHQLIELLQLFLGHSGFAHYGLSHFSILFETIGHLLHIFVDFCFGLSELCMSLLPLGLDFSFRLSYLRPELLI